MVKRYCSKTSAHTRSIIRFDLRRCQIDLLIDAALQLAKIWLAPTNWKRCGQDRVCIALGSLLG